MFLWWQLLACMFLMYAFRYLELTLCFSIMLHEMFLPSNRARLLLKWKLKKQKENWWVTQVHSVVAEMRFSTFYFIAFLFPHFQAAIDCQLEKNMDFKWKSFLFWAVNFPCLKHNKVIMSMSRRLFVVCCSNQTSGSPFTMHIKVCYLQTMFF